ncbi:MAG: hypothetical protein KGL53_04195 [Elusimicrobia bacterium]|nr:hypothetical protein [Elusimicrobiota bacterium]
MNADVVCPNCRAVQDAAGGPTCWLCSRPLGDLGDVPPPPARRLPGQGAEENATAVVLGAGFIAVAVGGALISLGFGLLSVLFVALPVAWMAADFFMGESRPKQQPVHARGPLHPAPPAPEPLQPLWRRILKGLGILAAAVILVPLAMTVALGVACAALVGGAAFVQQAVQAGEVGLCLLTAFGVLVYVLSR